MPQAPANKVTEVDQGEKKREHIRQSIQRVRIDRPFDAESSHSYFNGCEPSKRHKISDEEGPGCTNLSYLLNKQFNNF